MDEALVQAVTDRIWAAWGSGRPPALLLGREPAEDLGYRYVSEPPFDAIVIGSLTPGQLLYFRDERVLEALLEGCPRLFVHPGLPGRRGKNRVLQARLNAAQRELKAWGVVFGMDLPTAASSLPGGPAAEGAGEKAPSRGSPHPLAREILEQP
ncbi:MAG: hypothetical protein ACLSHU_01155 [Oscillospiraceae bacterium]